jgi:hypothetical protein
MALQQLVAGEALNGLRNPMHHHEKYLVRYTETNYLDYPIKWNQEENEFRLPRVTDTVEEMYLNLVVGPAPQGYRWKRCWPNFFFKRLYLSIGGDIIWDTRTEILQMEQLIRGSRGQSPECMFDFDDAERTERSRETHEVIIEPFHLKEAIKDNIPSIRLAFHTIKVDFETGSLADCIEPIEEMPPPLPNPNEANQLFHRCQAITTHMSYNGAERNTLARADDSYNVTIHTAYDSGLFEKDRGNRISMRTTQSYTCSSSYIWITDEDNKELPHSIVDSIEIKTNNTHLFRLNGLYSRHIVRNLVPHPTVENNKSQNLYYISFWSGRRNQHGMEQGLNYRRIDNTIWNIDLKENAPRRVKIHMCDRYHNLLRTTAGLGGLTEMMNGLMIRQARQNEVVAPPHAIIPLVIDPPVQVVDLVFPEPNKNIDIPADERMCMITYTDFEEGESVDKCGQCHKIFSTRGMKDWLITRNRALWKCVHCQQPYNTETFIRGKARLGVA